MEKFNWNYPTSMWVGENRIKDLSLACKNLNIKNVYFKMAGFLSKHSL